MIPFMLAQTTAEADAEGIPLSSILTVLLIVLVIVGIVYVVQRIK